MKQDEISIIAKYASLMKYEPIAPLEKYRRTGSISIETINQDFNQESNQDFDKEPDLIFVLEKSKQLWIN